MPAHRARSRWTAALLVVCLGCAAPAPYPLPAGIAELVLPADAATLQRIAAEDDLVDRLARRREIIAGVDRQLLMTTQPDDALVPELFDFVVALAPRMESGTIDAAWGSHLYTTYQRDLRNDRPSGRPRRSPTEIAGVLDHYVEFYRIQANPRVARPTAESQGFGAMRDWRNERRIGR